MHEWVYTVYIIYAKWDVVSFRPDLIEFHKLTRSNATHNLQIAFNIAEHHLGLTKLLDPEGDTSHLTKLN